VLDAPLVTPDYGGRLQSQRAFGARDGATITGGDFIDSNGNLVFDFAVTNLPGGYTVDLTATDATIAGNYGLFTCPKAGEPAASHPPRKVPKLGF